jgi:radical SAM superfamily enzyme YgiQ (UPF0313 family)
MTASPAENKGSHGDGAGRPCKILLMKPPFFTPWTPPLGISIIKSYLEQHGYSVQCYDYNTDSLLWSTHHKYFTALQSMEEVSINDGYSKLWWVLNAHMLAYANGGSSSACASVIEGVIPYYRLRYDHGIVKNLLEIVRKYFARLEELTDQIDLSGYAVAGVSTYTTSLASSLFILKKIKRKSPLITTVMGGGIFADDLALGSDNLNTLIEEYPYIDHVVLGEGEKLFHKLLQGELADKRVISISDIGGKTLEMKDVPSPDFSDLKAENYYHLTIEGARSCPFQCSFCSETIQWGNYRKKPVELFAEQVVELAKRYNNNAFFLGDSLMNPYIVQFSNALIKTGADILYDGYLRADKPVANREWVRTWAKSGLYRTRLGIESASARVLKGMDKMTTPTTISKALKTLSGAGIRTTTYWIVGFPGETEEDFQETLDFINEHHRFIYELEAHPFSYSPYGQVGSRLYQSKSLYPDAVTDIIRFKVWDVVGVGPGREERYDRLARISKLASELGVPNIYSMADRYQAEERWFRLHPLVKEIYQGTMNRRKESVLDETLVNHLGLSAPSLEPSRISPTRITSYRIGIAGKLEIDCLREAIPYLVRYNDIFQLGVKEASDLDGEGEPRAESDFTLVDLSAEPADSVDRMITDAIKTVAGEMGRPGAPLLRIALFRKGEEFFELVILAQRSVVDAKSLIILSEELYRIYEQLANRTEISLPDVLKTYLGFLKNAGASRIIFNPRPNNSEGGKPRAGDPNLSLRKKERTTLAIDGSHVRDIFSNLIRESGLKPAEIMLAAIFRTVDLTKDGVTLSANMDSRSLDAALENTAGPFTRLYLLPRELAEERNIFTFARSIRGVMGAPSSSGLGVEVDGEEGGAGANGPSVLLDLEYVTEPAWLGGDGWSAGGFLTDNESLSVDYDCIITPQITDRGIEIRVTCQGLVDMSAVSNAIVGCLASNLKAYLEECREYVLGQRFWLKEFKEEPQAALETASDQMENGLAERASGQYQLHKDLLSGLEKEYAAPRSMLILSAFTSVLSRLNGRESVAVLMVLQDHERLSAFPLKLYPSWNITFRQYIHEVSKKIREASRYGEFVLEALEKTVLGANEKRTPLALDVAYVLSYGENADSRSLEKALDSYPALSHEINVALLVDDRDDQAGIAYDYRPGKLSKKKLDQLNRFLTSVLESLKGDPDAHVGAVALETKTNIAMPSEAFINDAFNF